MKFFAVVFMLSSLVTGAFAQSAQEKDRAVINGLNQSIELLAKVDLSCKKATDCSIVTYGSRACGGPNGFVVTSSANGNMQEIEFLAKKSAEKEQVYNATYRVVSICSVLGRPTVLCENKVCVID